jgi:hypothetical protein
VLVEVCCCSLVSFEILFTLGEYQIVPADYAFLLLFNWISCVAFGLFMNMMVSGTRQARVSILDWFGIRDRLKGVFYINTIYLLIRF